MRGLLAAGDSTVRPSIRVNGAPMLILWAAVVAERSATGPRPP